MPPLDSQTILSIAAPQTFAYQKSEFLHPPAPSPLPLLSSQQTSSLKFCLLLVIKKPQLFFLANFFRISQFYLDHTLSKCVDIGYGLDGHAARTIFTLYFCFQ